MGKRSLYPAAALALALACLGSSVAGAASVTVPLVAGQFTPVGTVTVDNNATSLLVTYNVTGPGSCLEETHVYASKARPTKAAPGQFPFNHAGLSCTTSDSYVIPLSSLGAGIGTKLYIAAHAGVAGNSGAVASGLADLILTIDNVTNPVQITVDNGPSGGRWPITVTGAGALDGTYDGWCADPDNPFEFGVSYEANMSVSLTPPWSYVNYIANNFQVGDPSPSGGTYSVCDIQQGMHHFIAGYSFCTDNADQTHIDEIIGSANANGADFIPGCGEKLAVFLDAVLEGIQNQLILIPVPCTPVLTHDTAWALNGPNAVTFKTGWGQYFEYTTY